MKTTMLLFLASITRILSADIYVPPYPGNSDSGFPFTQFDMRYQQVYGAEAFSSLAPVGGGWITAIGFSRLRGSFEPGREHINAQFSFSTTTRLVDGLSTTFAENVGSDEQVVVGPVDINFESPPGPGLIRVNFDTPFFYDPNQGNLLMDVRMFRGVGGFIMPEFEASSLSTDSSSRVAAFDRDALTGNVSTLTLVTGFRITPVPEPSFTLLAVAALAALSFSVSATNHQPERNDPWPSTSNCSVREA